jgi:hypothetical protein
MNKKKPSHEEITAAKEVLKASGYVAVYWTIEDVMWRAKDIKKKVTKKQAQTIVDTLARTHDATIGISWDTIDYHIDEL